MHLGSCLGSWLLHPNPATTLSSQDLSILLLGVACSSASHPIPHHAAAYQSHYLIIQVWVTFMWFMPQLTLLLKSSLLPLHTLLGPRSSHCDQNSCSHSIWGATLGRLIKSSFVTSHNTLVTLLTNFQPVPSHAVTSLRIPRFPELRFRTRTWMQKPPTLLALTSSSHQAISGSSGIMHQFSTE